MANSVSLRERSRSPVVLHENPQSTIDRLLRELATRDAQIADLKLSCDIKQSIMDAMTGATKAQQETIKTLQASVSATELRIATLEGQLQTAKAISDIRQSVIDELMRMARGHTKKA